MRSAPFQRSPVQRSNCRRHQAASEYGSRRLPVSLVAGDWMQMPMSGATSGGSTSLRRWPRGVQPAQSVRGRPYSSG